MKILLQLFHRLYNIVKSIVSKDYIHFYKNKYLDSDSESDI
jgi:hypothetical protein